MWLIRTVLNKAWHIVPVLALVSLGSFFLLELVPGDPAVAVVGPEATAEEYDAVREQLGLEEPVGKRYADWVGGIGRLDLGQSLYPPQREVSDVIGQRLPVTIEVALLSLLLAMALAVPIAMRCAYQPGGAVDRVVTGLTFGAIAMPSFLAGLLLVFFFVFNPDLVKGLAVVLGVASIAGLVWNHFRLRRTAHPPRFLGLGLSVGAVAAATTVVVLWLPEFPRQGFVRLSDGSLGDHLTSIALPVLTLALTETAVFARLLRSDLIETLGEDFILSARAKGMPIRRILTRDALRPSLFSLVTVLGVSLGRLVGGSAIVEIIFNLPGMGRLIIDAIVTKDYPVVQASVLMVALVYVLASAAVDIVYAALDPRIRRG